MDYMASRVLHDLRAQRLSMDAVDASGSKCTTVACTDCMLLYEPDRTEGREKANESTTD